MSHSIAVVIPAFNEAGAIEETIKRIQTVAAAEEWDLELVVVDDGSTDGTGEKARSAGAQVIRHPKNGGYGISLQHGIAATSAPYIAITDADGTYPVEELPKLLSLVEDVGHDMAVGARTGTEYKKGLFKYPARWLFRWFAEYVAGRRIPDINSGLRVFRRTKLMPHLTRTCYGFSFTTSITLIFFLNGFFVTYLPIAYTKRIGASKVRHLHDTLRTAQILTSVICAYNPLKLFLLLAVPIKLIGLSLIIIGWVFKADTPFLLGGIFLLASAIIFALGCLAETVRTNTQKIS